MPIAKSDKDSKIMTTTSEVKPTAIATSTPVYGEFGSGRYSAAAKEFWGRLQKLLKISPQAADKITKHWMSDFGAAMKNAEVSASVTGKPDKSGMLTLKEAAKCKVIATYSISLMRLCAYLDEGFKHGLNPVASQYVLSEQLAQYIEAAGK